MTRRDLKRRLDDLEGEIDDDEDYVIVIGGDPEDAGTHWWDPDRGAYVNKRGHEIPPKDTPELDSDVDYYFDYGLDDD